MKKISVLIAAVMLSVLTLSSCSSYEANQVVYVYNWGEYIDSTVNDKFEEETGIKVIYDEYDNNLCMLRLKTERQNMMSYFPLII